MSKEIKNQEGTTNATTEVVDAQKHETSEAPDTSKMSVEELRSLAELALESKRAANAEAKGYRLKLEKIDSDKAKATEKQLKEQNRFEDLYTAEKKTREARDVQIKQIGIKSALAKEARKQGIIDEDFVDHVVNKVSDDFDPDKDSKKFISDWKKDKPKLFSIDNKTSTPPSAANILGGQPLTNDATKKPQTREEYYRQNPDKIFGTKSL